MSDNNIFLTRLSEEQEAWVREQAETQGGVSIAEVIKLCVDRSVPKKPGKDGDIYGYQCPACGRYMGRQVSNNCPHCGQAIDWRM